MGFMDRFLGAKEEKIHDSWINIDSIDKLEEIKTASFKRPVVIFKHSTSCGISMMAKYQLEDKWNFDEGELDFYYLDLIRHRDISNAVVKAFGVLHQSPQIIVIKDGEAAYNTSHHMINLQVINNAIQSS